MANAERLYVVAAVIKDQSGCILIAKRPEHLHQGGLWEFPGGKRDAGESREQCLVRELQEELGILAEGYEPLITISHDYPDRKVLLDVWLVSEFSGSPWGAEGQEIRWVVADDLGRYSFPAANRPIVSAATLPPAYAISPEPGDKENWDEFLRQLERTLSTGISLVQFRAKMLTDKAIASLAGEVLSRCHAAGCRVLLNGEPSLAKGLGFDGVHLSSVQLAKLRERPMPGEFLVAASCHSTSELKHAEEVGCDFAVLGPVNETKTHPGVSGMGWQRFEDMAVSAGLPVYALGGMKQADVMQARIHGGQGIAAIRGLWSV